MVSPSTGQGPLPLHTSMCAQRWAAGAPTPSPGWGEVGQETRERQTDSTQCQVQCPKWGRLCHEKLQLDSSRGSSEAKGRTAVESVPLRSRAAGAQKQKP